MKREVFICCLPLPLENIAAKWNWNSGWTFHLEKNELSIFAKLNILVNTHLLKPQHFCKMAIVFIFSVLPPGGLCNLLFFKAVLLMPPPPLSPSASLNVCTYTYTYTHTHTHTKNYPMYTVLLLPLFKTICMSILSPSVCINPSIISCNIFCPTLLWLGIHYIWPEPPPSPNYYQENDPQTFSIHRSMHFWPPPFLFS